MKPDSGNKIFSSISRRLLCIPAFLFLLSRGYSQESLQTDSVKRTGNLQPVTISNIEVSLGQFINGSAPNLRLTTSGHDGKTTLFLDSLENKASKKLITRKLYDVMIVSSPSPKREITGSSDGTFRSYSGLKIRNISIKRLSVFGTNIHNPDFFEPNKIENILNKTHLNTNENIIRKNLLFNIGDTVSPLILSDNERIIRELPYIDDARIIVLPVSENEADVIVITKDLYSLGANFKFSGFDKASLSVYEKNIFGMGHEFGIDIPYNSRLSDVPGFGVHYKVNNISRTFANFGAFYLDGLGNKTYGFDLSRKLVSSETKYAGGITVTQMYTTDDLDTLPVPVPLKYNLQDYWLMRSFLLNRKSVSRLVLGVRYINNNVFRRPEIEPDSYHSLQRYKMYLGSFSLSMQKYHKAKLIYGYGRTEDIPYGTIFNITVGRELNEFKQRYYFGSSLSVGQSIRRLGYIYSSAGFATFYNGGRSEQGVFDAKIDFFTNLNYLGRYRNRTFFNAEYTRGINRYSDEYLQFVKENGFSGFRNDSTGNDQRFAVGLESVLFSPWNFYGFKFAFYGFADWSFLFGMHDYFGSGDVLSSVGIGVRIRNDNLLFNTLQIRLCFFPNLPDYSRVTNLIISGEQLLKPENFEPQRPSLLPFK